MKISIDKLQQLLSQKAEQFVTKKEAEYFARLQMDVHLKKYPRTNPLKEAIGDLENWKKAKNHEIKKVVDKPSVTIFDFNGLAPSVKIYEIHQEIVDKAKTTGMASVGLVNSKGLHTLALWTELLAERGLVALCMANGGPAAVVPFGAKGGKNQAVFGTNPISYSIPTNSNPITTDMATSQIPFFDIVNAKKGESKLSRDAVVDKDGNPTNDPDKTILDGEVANISPLGAGIKGTALIALFEVMTSSLVRSPNSIEMNQNTFIPEEHGNMILAFNVATYTDEKRFRDSNTKLAKKVSELKPKKSIEKVYYPGERSQTKHQTRIESGEIEISNDLYKTLKNL